MAGSGDDKYDSILALLEQLKAVADSTGSKVDALYKARQQKEAQISDQEQRKQQSENERIEREKRRLAARTTKEKERETEEMAKKDEEGRAAAAAQGVYYL